MRHCQQGPWLCCLSGSACGWGGGGRGAGSQLAPLCPALTPEHPVAKPSSHPLRSTPHPPHTFASVPRCCTPRLSTAGACLRPRPPKPPRWRQPPTPDLLPHHMVAPVRPCSSPPPPCRPPTPSLGTPRVHARSAALCHQERLHARAEPQLDAVPRGNVHPRNGDCPPGRSQGPPPSGSMTWHLAFDANGLLLRGTLPTLALCAQPCPCPHGGMRGAPPTHAPWPILCCLLRPEGASRQWR